ncbi:MAG: GT4 family glycosyltransferase PelF [Sulfuricella denitrificans]|nr:GT4 family glycosyltransferase PelF [Sulfuricella denitrificans]
MTNFPKAREADIALLLEGTFPFVSGGVSSWVHQLIQGFPEYRFACIFLGSRPQDYGNPRYELPANVVHLEVHYLHDAHIAPPSYPTTSDANTIADMADFHAALRQSAQPGASHGALADRLAGLLGQDGIDEHQFLHSKEAWDYITEQYREHCTDPSFVDYFWTVRSMHQPIWQLQRIADNLIPVKLIHTVSTGYAGFLGALLKQRTGRPLLLSEHGIYTKERKIDLLQSDWLADNRDLFQQDPTQISYFRDLWIRFFSSLGRMCYGTSDQIVALFEANRQRQIEDGAQPDKTRSIPNGINVKKFEALYLNRPESIPPVLCLIGRVVPVKDVKTFIRAMRIIANRLPEAEAWIAGPQEEDPGYALECKALAASLGLADKVRFLGLQNMETLLPKVGLTVLSSISEGLPLVLLESMAAGVPVVATDVGACKELVEGLPGEDQALGTSGVVVRIADPESLAHAALSLLGDAARWLAASTAGRARVQHYYRDSQMFEAYRTTYQDILQRTPTRPSAAGCPHAARTHQPIVSS